MNKILSIISILSLILLMSCAEDRTYQFNNLTQHNIWMYDIMKDKYLWADNLPEQETKNYFATPQEYFATLIKNGKNDYASYIEIDSLIDKVDNHQRGNFMHNSSYGFDFTITNYPSGTSNSYARVTTVYSDSPASKAGLKRNDFIETYDGTKVTSKNLSNLQKGTSHELGVRNIVADTTIQEYVLSDPRKINISESCYVEDKAFPVNEVFNIDTIIYNSDTLIIEDNIGYLMCNRLVEQDDSIHTKYKEQLDSIMTDFKLNNVNQLVLDLRLCNFGTINMANRLASYIVPNSSLSNVFAKTVWNSKYTENDTTFHFDNSLKTLDLSKVAVITSSYTQGAAEWLIKALQSAFGSTNVIIVGTATKGQYCMAQHTEDYDNIIHLYPAVAYVLSANEDSENIKSIEVTHSVDEFSLDDESSSDDFLYDYGDINESLLRAAIYYLYTDSLTKTK